MAQNRFSASILKRSGGGNACARAAYNGRCKLTDERTGQTWDFTKKGGIEFSGIFAPDDAPKWVKDRQALWNEVEAREDKSKRYDQAQLARDFKISLPHELSKQQREWLVKDFARELARKGMVVDVSIHAPDKHGDDRNYHVHMLATMREIGRDGFGKKVREWNKVEELEKLRERWSELGAKALERAGFTIEAERFREGHKTLKEQKKAAERRGDREWAEHVDREPTKPLGPNAKAMEREDGFETKRGRENGEIKDRNSQREFDREVKRDDRKRGPVAQRIANAYEKSINAEDFRARLLADNLHVARVTRRDIELYGPDYSDPREELKRLQHLSKQGAWMAQRDGLKGLSEEQRDRAHSAYEKYRLEHERSMTFDGYVKFVQMQTQRRMDHLAEYGKTLDFSDGGVKKSDFYAKEGEYVVLTKNGHVYRLNQATTGESRDDVKKFMSSLDGKAVQGVTETRDRLEAMRVAESAERAAAKQRRATKGHSKLPFREANRKLDEGIALAGRPLRPVARTLGLMTGALNSVADMFVGSAASRDKSYEEASQEHQRDVQRRQDEDEERNRRLERGRER